MTPALILTLVMFSFLLASGQIVFKLAARTSPPLADIAGLMGLATNAWFWLALVLYGTATLIWIYILQKIDLVQAYPFIALGFIIVPLAAKFLLGEHLNVYYFAGVAMILAGIWFIVVKAGLSA